MNGLDIVIGLAGLVAAVGALITWRSNKKLHRARKAHRVVLGDLPWIENKINIKGTLW